MACRVGITTNLGRRKDEHVRAYRNVRNWRIYGPFPNRNEAQNWENSFALRNGCDSHGGGSDPSNPFAEWYGYYFEHDGGK